MLGRFFLGLWLYVQIILVQSKPQADWTRLHGFHRSITCIGACRSSFEENNCLRVINSFNMKIYIEFNICIYSTISQYFLINCLQAMIIMLVVFFRYVQIKLLKMCLQAILFCTASIHSNLA